MVDDADIFFPADITARYAIEALDSIFTGFKKGKEFIFDKPEETIKKYEERNLEKEQFDKDLNE
jgi:hypothetical protein